MEKVHSDFSEKFFDSKKGYMSSMEINKSINHNIEKDSSIGDIVIEKRKEEKQMKLYLLNYFDSETGENKKILVKRLKK